MKKGNRVIKLFELKFSPTKDTFVAFITGIAVILVSIALNLFSGESIGEEIGFYLLRDIIMIAGIGFIFPVYYVTIIKKESISSLGVTKKKLGLSLLINIIFSILLLFQFISNSNSIQFTSTYNIKMIIPIMYIFVAGIFEMIFFYGFLREFFERAFGIIPSILLTAVFYSFHHAGFQPEFLKLIFVGIMYASVYRITRNVFIIFPFFWGIGATWDVIVNFGAGSSLEGSWTLFKAMSTLLLIIGFSIYVSKKKNAIALFGKHQLQIQ